MDRSKTGTRITLSERFKMIRNEQQTRKIYVNPSIESSNMQRPMKDFFGTVSRNDRPRALLQQGSERNRRLVLQMATNTQLMEELRQNSQMLTNLSPMSQQQQMNHSAVKILQQTPKKLSVRARLGLKANQNTSSVKSRLGRKPVAQRLGLAQTLKSSGRINMRNRSNGMISTPNNQKRHQTRIFRSRNRFNGSTKFNNGYNNSMSQINRRNKNNDQLRKNNSKKKNFKITAETLDKDLDSYMQTTD